MMSVLLSMEGLPVQLHAALPLKQSIEPHPITLLGGPGGGCGGAVIAESSVFSKSRGSTDGVGVSSVRSTLMPRGRRPPPRDRNPASSPIIQSDSAAVLPCGGPSISILHTSISATPAAFASVTKGFGRPMHSSGS
jgi:hypothetical protein